MTNINPTDPICRKCGKRESDHCEFTPLPPVPPGCSCNPMNFPSPDDIKLACAEFISWSEDPDQCEICGHTRECHSVEDKSETSTSFYA